MAGKKGIAGRKDKFTTEEVKQLALDAIRKDDKVVFLTDVFKMAGYTQDTFYRYCPKGSPAWQEVTEALDRNKGDMKKEIRDRLMGMNNPTALICLYKLLGTADERAALNNHKTKDDIADKDDNSNDIILEIS